MDIGIKSTRAKLLIAAGLLLSITVYTGYKLYSVEDTIRRAIVIRDSMHSEDEKIGKAISLLDKSSSIAADFLLGHISANTYEVKVSELITNSLPLIDKTNQLGQSAFKELQHAKSHLEEWNGTAKRLSEINKHILSANHIIHEMDYNLDERIEQMRVSVQNQIDTPESSLLLLITCLSLILAILALVIKDIFIPLDAIVRELTTSADNNFKPTVILPARDDEIGTARKALYKLLFRVTDTVNELKNSHQSHARKIAAIEASKGGIGITDKKGNLIFANQALFDIHGIDHASVDQYMNAPSMYLYSESDRPLLFQKILPAVQNNGYWQGETEFTALNGEKRYGEFSLTMLSDGSLIGTVIDITARRKAEDERAHVEKLFLQAQKMEAIGRLTGGIAHDSNNMLTIVQGNLELLLQSGIQDNQHKYIETALRAIARSTDLTSRLLSFSRQQHLAPKPVFVNELIQDASILLSKALEEDMDIVFDLGEDPGQIFVDPSQLETALLNLIINARDAISDDGIIILRTGKNVENKSILISIEDNGSGMTPDVIAHVFEPFFTTKPASEGTGLGLSMVYGFVQQSGGKVDIHSESGKGTRIDLYFPIYNGLAEAPRIAITEKSQKDYIHQGTVLIAEDEDDLRELNRSLLTDLGYNVLCAQDGVSALKILHDNPDIKLIVSDIVMPGHISGRELANEAIRFKKDIKILLVSGYSKELSENGIQSEPWNFLAKPYTRSGLAHEIHTIMSQ
jgi:PAS domain S-box-containing protein